MLSRLGPRASTEAPEIVMEQPIRITMTATVTALAVLLVVAVALARPLLYASSYIVAKRGILAVGILVDRAPSPAAFP